MSSDLIRYDLLVQDALRSVVRRVLTEASREGLPGDHHFFVSFRTQAPGVRLSTRMRERYPDEMTIVLQHQFWDLSVTEANFEVGLSFNNIAESVLVPFEAITQFGDPSVGFALKFELQEPEVETGANDIEPAIVPAKPMSVVPTVPRPAELAKTEPARAEPAKAAAEPEKKPEPAKAEKSADEPDPSSKVVSIDAFRKKT